MSWESEEQQDLMQEWVDFGVFCEIHQEWYLPTHGNMCSGCEDGEPTTLEHEND